MKRIYMAGMALLIMIGIGGNPLHAAAGSIYESPYVTFAPDGRAWTTDADNTQVEWYREGGIDDIATGRTTSLDPLQEGEHYYAIQRTGNIPVSYWRVQLSEVNCCHMNYPTEEYHGISYTKRPCLKPHFSAWYPICADCGEPISRINFYMSRTAAASIDQLEAGTGLAYYYLCPFNHNLEQGTVIRSHTCKAISANRYRVDYLPNADGEAYSGYMAPSFHIYDNASVYEGREVTPQTHLNKNLYQRIGWKFMGWNTEADGSGDFYADEAEIKNLCAEQYETDSERGRVKLYAVWQQCSGRLELLLEECSYKGQTGSYSVTKAYGEVYELVEEELEMPDGYLVSFDTKGGKQIPPIRGTQHFQEWIPVNPLAGQLEENRYRFTVPDGNVDVIRPVFLRDAIVLPGPEKAGEAFGGWYYDEAYTQFAGTEGSRIIPQRDICLYARWVELRLQAADDHESYGGAGAVDLHWTQEDDTPKIYQLFQSEDGRNWKQIYTADRIGSPYVAAMTYSGDGNTYQYEVAYSGYYRISAYGAQGGNYNEFLGGKGGAVSGLFWLERGDLVSVRAGMQYGDSNGGNGNPYAGGGGCSIVSSKQKGTLLIAGGGGGAGANGNGLSGGSSQNLLPYGMAGETGGSGGGGGYQGGRAGELIVHHHVPGVCNHLHEGDPHQYGGCYTLPIICGRPLEHVLTGTETWYWGGPDEEYCPNCGADASKGESCIGHETEYYSHICPVHGVQADNAEAYKPSRCSVIALYVAGCGRTEKYICVYQEGQILSSKPAYGGSSYINAAIAVEQSAEPGKQAGDGVVFLQPESVGYQSDTYLKDVMAKDKAAPCKIDRQTVVKSVTGTDMIQVQWQKPEDFGTTYYHQAKSYAQKTGGNIGISNVTENTLVSGVKGYYYCVDTTSVKEYAEDFAYMEYPACQAILTDEMLYLHVAPVDVAGNIGEVLHIELGNRRNGPADAAWKLHTDPLRIETGNHVYEDIRQNIYYVKCDGKTPFVLNFASSMDGAATTDYQLNYAVVESWPEGENSSRNTVYVPSDETVAEQTVRKADELRFWSEGTSRVQDGDYVVVERSDYGKRLHMKREYILKPDAESIPILLVPITGAKKAEDVVYSDHEEDKKNGVIIIGDGEAPVISGLEELENLHLLDRRESTIVLALSAWDELSGVREFYLEVENADNGAQKKIYPDQDGVIRADITVDEPIFSGDFTVTVSAIDRVGNESHTSYTTLEFDLKARVERILEPHEPVFHCGESGILTITTWGYAERVEVEFPEALTMQDDTLGQVYVYELKPFYKQEEKYSFQIPLYVPENADYQVIVRAYKGEAMLERYPAFAVMDISGSVLDEVRTRLR